MNPDNKMEKQEPFTLSNYQRLSGLTERQVLSLTGIYGYNYLKARRAPRLLIYGNRPRLTVIVERPGITLIRTINLETREIVNSTFNLTIQKQKFGTKVLRAQVRAAASLGFTLITCRAQGSFTQPSNGYITWGKLGYSMCDEDEINDFLDLVTKFGVSPKSLNPPFNLITLYEFLQSKSGEDHWYREGGAWDAEFRTTGNSQNTQWLNVYLSKKGLATL